MHFTAEQSLDHLKANTFSNETALLRPQAYTFTQIFIHVRNPCKRHVSLSSSISKPYIQSNNILINRIYGLDMLEQREAFIFQCFEDE